MLIWYIYVSLSTVVAHNAEQLIKLGRIRRYG